MGHEEAGPAPGAEQWANIALGPNIGDQTLGPNFGVKHWGATLGTNIGNKHWEQTFGAKHWG